MSTESNTPKKPAYDAAKIDEAIKRAKEQAGEKPAKTKEPKAEKPAKEPKAEKEPRAAKEPKAKEPKAKEPKAEKPAKEPKGPAHLSKVERATADLPKLTPAASQFVIEIGKGVDEGLITAGDLTVLAAHLTHRARLLMTAGAVSAKPTVGSLVEILPGDKGVQKYVGMRGVLTEVRSIRCFADIKDENGKTVKKGLYLFTSGVKVIEAAQAGVDEAAEPEALPAEPTAGEFPIDPVATTSDDADQGLTDADAQASDEAEAEAVQAEGNETAGVEATGTDG